MTEHPTAPPEISFGRGQAAAAGVLTGLSGLAVSLATTGVLHQRLTPVQAVAEAIAEVTPGRLAEALIQVVGSGDKPILLAGVVLGLVGLSAVAGLQARQRMWRGQAVFLAMGLLALSSVLGQSGPDTAGILPVLLGTVTWVVVLPVLAREREAPGGDLDRRTFLRRAGLVGLGALVVAAGGEIFGRKRAEVEAARSRLSLAATKGTVPADAEVGLEGIESWRVANPDFYRIDTAFSVPTIDVDRWRLRIHGMVENELTLTYQDLLDRETTEAWVTLCCVSNQVGGDLIGNAWWSGTRIADILAEAKPLPGADAVLQTSEDDWNCGTPLQALTDDRDAMLAVAMNGEPLPLEHGFPVRMVVPGLYGFVSATKWLVDIEVTRFADIEAFWTTRGWSERGPVRTQSRIDVPSSNHRVSAGAVPVGGVAWAQHVGVQAVEVRLDGGAWAPVDLGGVPTDDTWVQWGGAVDVTPGVHTLAVRATDKSGYTQTGVQRDVVPDGATGWHTIEFTAE